MIDGNGLSFSVPAVNADITFLVDAVIYLHSNAMHKPGPSFIRC